jgi:MerR family copper efflux transcriptional regulator
MPYALFTIGEASRRAGVSADTLRYYERQGLLPPAERTPAGYRLYSADAIEQIRVVRNAVRFGFSVKDVAAFLSARRNGRPPCQRVRSEGARLLEEMDRRIRDMTAAREQMRTTLEKWDRQLAATPPGAAARLLQTIPAQPITVRRG